MFIERALMKATTTTRLILWQGIDKN